MNKLLLSLLGAALLPALTQCNTLEKDIAGNALLGTPAPARPDLENGPTRHHG